MWLAAVGALTAFVSSVSILSSADTTVVWLETWRAFGFLMFAGMFVLLALRPRRSPGVLELAFFHKAAMTVSALFLRNAAGATSAGLVDGALAAMLLVAYLCGKGWHSWSRS